VGDLIEYEFDHIFLGNYNGRPKINKEEADDWKWVRPNELIKNVKKNPKKYAAWFKKIFKKVLEWEKIEKKLSLQKLYKELYLKYGRPAGQWKLWCKRPKTSKEREEVIIGAILTQRANWKNVELAINNLKKARVCSIKGIYGMGERNKKNLANLVKPSGFFQQKADYLFNLAKYILKKYKSIGKMKKENTFDLRKGLLSQKGIGKETADSILLYALDKPVFVIDEYTRRLVGLKQYDFLQELFEKNLNPPSLPPSLKLLRTRKLWRARNNYRLYQDFHALIVIDGKTK
jgi:endonuclease-3 related protein